MQEENNMYIRRTTSPAETEEIGAALAKKLTAAGEKRHFIALYGEMGVGKTAFVRGFVSVLGCNAVKSPTYTVVNEYRGQIPLFHFDLYRIDGEDDLYSVGFDDYLARNGIILTEWSERIPEAIPADAIRVTIARGNGENERTVTIEGAEL